MLLINDMIYAALVAYGLSIHCSLDALNYWPFIVYRTICKLIKQIQKDDLSGHG